MLLQLQKENVDIGADDMSDFCFFDLMQLSDAFEVHKDMSDIYLEMARLSCKDTYGED